MEAVAPTVDINEAVKLAATNGNFYSQVFFPKTARFPPAKMHKEMWDVLDDPRIRYANFIISRDFAKTSLLRLFLSKRIAYNISRTIMYIGASEDKAVSSIDWIRKAVDRNLFWSGTFNLQRGSKWGESDIEIIHGIYGTSVRVVGYGVTGSIRGVNFDDYRPDLIVCDDILTDENAATLEQREKMKRLILDAVKNSLAPATEEPNAKLVLLNTPQHVDDVAMAAQNDPDFVTIIRGCWTEETKELPLDQQESAWPERHPTETLRQEKRNAIAANKLSGFLREKECRLVSPETATFRAPWLKLAPKPIGAHCVVAIDPVPPPTERQMAKALKGKDYEVVGVIGRKGADYFVMDYATSRGHDPTWTIAKTFELAMRYRAVKIVIEAVAYQRVLKFLLEQEMQRRKLFWPVIPFEDRRAKFSRITGALQGLASQGHLYYCDPGMSELVEQFTNYGPLYSDHDDVLDMVSIGVQSIANPFLELGEDEYSEPDGVPAFAYKGRAP